MKAFLTVAFSIVIVALHAQSLNQNWKKELTTSLEQFLNCEASADNACVKIQGDALNKVYKVNDFFSQKTGRYMTVNEVSAFLAQSTTWTALGPVYQQETLTQAQQFANEKKAVVAVYKNASGIGHVALITPGELQPSGSWGLNVPNAASFFLPEPNRSFIDKGLSFAFTKIMMKDISLYVRKY